MRRWAPLISGTLRAIALPSNGFTMVTALLGHHYVSAEIHGALCSAVAMCVLIQRTDGSLRQ